MNIRNEPNLNTVTRCFKLRIVSDNVYFESNCIFTKTWQQTTKYIYINISIVLHSIVGNRFLTKTVFNYLIGREGLRLKMCLPKNICICKYIRLSLIETPPYRSLVPINSSKFVLIYDNGILNSVPINR